MADMPAMLLWTDAYMADTSHLTTYEHGAYLLILMAMWRAGGYLPNDDIRLARTARTTPGKWAQIAPTIRQFLTIDGDTVTQKRLMVEISNARCRKTNFESAGKLGGLAKALKYNKSVPSIATEMLIAKSCLPIPNPEERKQNLKVLQKPKAPRKFKHELPEDWVPDAGDFDYGSRLGLTASIINGQHEAMTLWAKSNKIVKADWHATLKGFLRGYAEKHGVNPTRAPGQPMVGLYYAKRDTPQWAEWQNWYFKTKGKSAPTDKNGGWHFPSEWPPKVQEAAE